MVENPVISIVVPCFNDDGILPQTLARLHASAQATGLSYEMVLVDDGSGDRTWEVIAAEARKDSRVRGVRLSRNFGHQMALTAGLERARGSEVLIIDDDLQDPPELLGVMLAKRAEGFDVVYGQRRSRAGETWFKLITAKLFYRLIRYLAEVPIPPDTGDFRLMSRRAVDAFLSCLSLPGSSAEWLPGSAIPRSACCTTASRERWDEAITVWANCSDSRPMQSRASQSNPCALPRWPAPV